MPQPARSKGRRSARRPLGGQKNADRLFISSIQELLVSIEGNLRLAARKRVVARRQMKSMNGIEEEKCAHALVKILIRVPKPLQVFQFGENLLR